MLIRSVVVLDPYRARSFSSLLALTVLLALAVAYPRSATAAPEVTLLDSGSLTPLVGGNPIHDLAVINLGTGRLRSLLITTSAPRLRLHRGVPRSFRRLPLRFRYLGAMNRYGATLRLTSGRYFLASRADPLLTKFRIVRRSERVHSPTPAPNTPPPPPSRNRISAPSSAPPIPALSLWQSNMQSFGSKHCNQAEILSLSTWEGSVWYYDGMRIYQQIAAYTGDPSWNRCAAFVRAVYRPYVLNAAGRIGGWRVFAEGLRSDFLATNDAESRRAVIQLATNSPFAAHAGGYSFELSRETAYLINAYLSANEVGQSTPQLPLSVNYALDHLRQWRFGEAGNVKPFMAALTFEALIRYEERSGDARVLPAIQSLADWMWENLWDNRRGAFPYIYCRDRSSSAECDSPDNEESVNLNLLIAPAYAWLYARTGEAKYQTQGDLIFRNGVERAWLGGGKPFSQNYRWSFKFVEWRGGR